MSWPQPHSRMVGCYEIHYTLHSLLIINFGILSYSRIAMVPIAPICHLEAWFHDQKFAFSATTFFLIETLVLLTEKII